MSFRSVPPQHMHWQLDCCNRCRLVQRWRRTGCLTRRHVLVVARQLAPVTNDWEENALVMAAQALSLTTASATSLSPFGNMLAGTVYQSIWSFWPVLFMNACVTVAPTGPPSKSWCDMSEGSSAGRSRGYAQLSSRSSCVIPFQIWQWTSQFWQERGGGATDLQLAPAQLVQTGLQKVVDGCTHPSRYPGWPIS